MLPPYNTLLFKAKLVRRNTLPHFMAEKFEYAVLTLHEICRRFLHSVPVLLKGSTRARLHTSFPCVEYPEAA
jgi:hypothetical protein